MELAPPELVELKAKLNGEPITLKLRVFTLADVGRVSAEYGDNWYQAAASGDSDMALSVLSEQIENREEIEEAAGTSDLRGWLKAFTPAGVSQQKEAVVALSELLARSLPSWRAKKKARASLLKSTILLSALCIAAAGGFALARYFA